MTDHRAIEPDALPTPDRPWNHGVLSDGGILSVSGQPALDEDGTVVRRGDVRGQFDLALENLAAVVREAGGSMGDLVELTIYVTDLRDWRDADAGSLRYEHLDPPYPASTLLEVSGLARPGMLVEVAGTAVLRE